MDFIPVIDLAPLFEENSPEVEKKVAKAIEKALHGIGFMYLINHRIPYQTIKEGFKESANFFDLPLETKLKYNKTTDVPNGFIQAGQELLHPNSVFEIRECFDVTGGETKLISEAPNFNSALSAFEKTSTVVVKKLLRLLAIGLKLDDPEFFVKCSTHLENSFVQHTCGFRAIYYPSIPADKEITEGTVRCAEHTDYEIFTLLFQDEIGGLEVKATTGKWVEATPIPGSIIVNTGDLLQFWTNGYFPATYHRVVIPRTEILKRTARYSFAYFFAPDDSTPIESLKSSLLQNALVEGNRDNNEEENKLTVTAGEHIEARMRAATQY